MNNALDGSLLRIQHLFLSIASQDALLALFERSSVAQFSLLFVLSHLFKDFSSKTQSNKAELVCQQQRKSSLVYSSSLMDKIKKEACKASSLLSFRKLCQSSIYRIRTSVKAEVASKPERRRLQLRSSFAQQFL